MSKENAFSLVIPGNLDGVHLGHQYLIEQAKSRAQNMSLRLVALFFDPHPLAFLRPEYAPAMLTTIQRRKELLRQYGVDEVVVQSFDASFSRLSPAQFVEQILWQQLQCRAVLVGPDFRFGHRRAGTVDTLRELGKPFGLDVLFSKALFVPPHVIQGSEEKQKTRNESASKEAPSLTLDTVVSSSLIRKLIAAGEVYDAQGLLGRPHRTDGQVITGDQRARTLGFPTANLGMLRPSLLPSDGVYAVNVRREAEPEGRLYLGMANIGVRPTFHAGRSVEVHLFDMNEDLYGETLQVEWVDRLRDEVRFDGIESLKAQLQKDEQRARQVLS